MDKPIYNKEINSSDSTTKLEVDFSSSKESLEQLGNPKIKIKREVFDVKVEAFELDWRECPSVICEPTLGGEHNLTENQMEIKTECTGKNSDCQCPLCNVSFLRKSKKLNPENLVVHSKSDNPFCKEDTLTHIKKSKSFKCTKCFGLYSCKASLNRHILSVHERIKKFKCTQCNYACSEIGNLSKHNKAVHEKLKPFKCTDCNCTFSGKQSLSTHIKSIHEKLKPFMCLECNYAFSQKVSLSIHIKSVHEKLKPYKCLECAYTCSEKGSLNKHIRSVHEKLKPFKCFECVYSCSRKPDLTRHMKSIHEKIKYF